LVFAHPFFGDQFPWPALEDLRQGEGIIDIVNTYLGVGLNYGFVGIFFFVSFMLLGIFMIYARIRDIKQSDPDWALCGITLIACMVGTLVMIDSDSFTLAPSVMFYVLAGLGTTYVRLANSSPQKTRAIRPIAAQTGASRTF
jgi:O-antigen ligase